MLSDWASTKRERLLIVSDPGDLARIVRRRYPQFDVVASSDYLTAIADLAKSPAKKLLVGIDPNARKLSNAIGGLRKAAGKNAKMILFCLPSAEPAAREALASGGDDYIIYPPQGHELDRILDLSSPNLAAERIVAEQATPSLDELAELAEVLAAIGEGAKPMLERLCKLIADSLKAPAVQIVVQNDSAHFGQSDFEPVLAETIDIPGQNPGKIFIGARHRLPYSTAEVQKLNNYRRLIGHLLEAAQKQHHWQTLAMIDAITQLPNRRYLMQVLDTLIKRAAAERFRLTVLIFDLDGFKHFNDTYVHAAGDQILYETGQLFRRQCRRHDIVARYAGDEFVVVFWDAEEPRKTGSKHPSDALEVLGRVRKALKSHEFPKLGPEAKGCITISGGLASFPWDATNAQELIDQADKALLEAKRHGKNQIYLVGSKMKPLEESSAG